MHREGGGGTRGETGARKEGGKGACQLCRRRVTNRPTAACYYPASPGIFSISLSLFLFLSLFLLYPVYRITAVPQCSSRVTTAQCLPRVVARDRLSTIVSLVTFNEVYFSSKIASFGLFFFVFFFDIIKATATRYSFLPFDNITFHVPAREKVRLVPRAPLFFQKEEKKEREREKCARSRVLCENGFSRRDGYSRLGQRLAYPLKPEPADLRNGTEVSLVL